jgi:hypothetical protein
MVASILGVPRVTYRCTLLQTRDFASATHVEVLLVVVVRVRVFSVVRMFEELYNAWEIGTRTELYENKLLKTSISSEF